MELLTVIWNILQSAIEIFSAATVGIVVRPCGWSYVRNLKYTLLISLTHHDLSDLIMERLPRTIDTYRAYMEKQGNKPDIVILEKGALGGWIGSSKAKDVLLYFHGGGYINSAQVFALPLFEELIASMRNRGIDFSVFMVDYGLLPESRYPLQLVQGVHALKYLLDEGQRDPRDIYISGDSAGGNLATGVMAHLSHPHPAAPRIELVEKLGGVYLISPWVSFTGSSASMKANKKKDFIKFTSLEKLSAQFVGSAGLDGYNMPLSASPDWWKSLQVQNLCIMAGEYEIFLTDIEDFAAAVKLHNPQTEYYCAPAEIHVGMLVDRGLGLGLAKSEIHFRSWLAESILSAGAGGKAV